jgi:hypothetical protein
VSADQAINGSKASSVPDSAVYAAVGGALCQNGARGLRHARSALRRVIGNGQTCGKARKGA